MRASRALQPLTYDVRLPDEAQADALRLLDAGLDVTLIERNPDHVEARQNDGNGPRLNRVGVAYFSSASARVIGSARPKS